MINEARKNLHDAIDKYDITDSRVLEASQELDGPITSEQTKIYEEYKKNKKELNLEEVRQNALGAKESRLIFSFKLYGMEHEYEGSFGQIIDSLVEFHSGQLAGILLIGEWSELK